MSFFLLMTIPNSFNNVNELKKWKKENIQNLSGRVRSPYSSPMFFQIRCYNISCPFLINYSGHNKCGEYKGLFLSKYELFHLENCIFQPLKKDFKYSNREIAIEINEKCPSSVFSTTELIKLLAIHYSNQQFTKSEVKYIQRIIHSYRKNPTILLNQCLEYAKFGWNIITDFKNGMLDSILLFPPNLVNLMKYYPSPIIADATFTSDDYRILITVQLDGERHVHISGIAVRCTEDSDGYNLIFKQLFKYVPNEIEVTIITDDSKVIPKSICGIRDNIQLSICCFHLWNSVIRIFKINPPEELCKKFYQCAYGISCFDSFIRELKIYEKEKNAQTEDLNYHPVSDYLIKKSSKFIPSRNKKLNRRFCVTTQSIESVNNILKLSGRGVIDVIRMAIQKSQE